MHQNEVNPQVAPENRRQTPSLSLMIWLIVAVSAVLGAMLVSQAPTLVIIATTAVLCLMIVCVTLVAADRADLIPDGIQRLFDGLSQMLDKINPWHR